MNLWIGVLAAAAGCYMFKLLGLSIPHGVLERPTVRRIAALLPVALLAALVGVQTFADGETVVIDARLAGLAVAVAALLLRAPFLVVVFAAAATTALLRLAF
jgi:branched-subunit amino acid transport protein